MNALIMGYLFSPFVSFSFVHSPMSSPFTSSVLLSLSLSPPSVRRSSLVSLLNLSVRFSASSHPSNLLRQTVYCDFLLRFLDESASRGLTTQEQVALFALFHGVQECIISDSPISSVVPWFLDHLLGLTLDRPPHSIGLLSQDSTQFALQFASSTYFRYLRHLKYVFQARRLLDVQVINFAPEPTLEPLEAAREGSSQWNIKQQNNQLPSDSAPSTVEFSRSVPSSPPVDSSLSSSPFHSVLSKAIEQLEKEFSAKLAAQQESFSRRLSELS
jgi:hypothetical protein